MCLLISPHYLACDLTSAFKYIRYFRGCHCFVHLLPSTYISWSLHFPYYKRLNCMYFLSSISSFFIHNVDSKQQSFHSPLDLDILLQGLVRCPCRKSWVVGERVRVVPATQRGLFCLQAHQHGMLVYYTVTQ